MRNTNFYIALIIGLLYGNTMEAQTSDHTNFLNGLVSAYSMENASMFPDELNTNNGTVTGATLTDGNIGGALNFSGSQASIAIVPTSPSLDIDGTGITLMVDIYPTANGQSGTSVVVQKAYSNGGDNVYGLGYNASNKIRWRNYINGARQDFISTTSAPLNTWSRIICVWKSGEAKTIRINSSLDTEGTVHSGTQSVHPSSDLTIGSIDITNVSDTRSFLGKIDNVMIWNRALTVEEQNTLINQNLGFADFSSGSSVWSVNGSTAFYDNGNVAIGRTTVPTGYLLAVDGKVRAREIKVDAEIWPDYVFKENYDLPSLEEVRKYIKEKGHLINIPSAAEIETSGLELGEMNRLLLEKIEELTLYMIDLNKQVNQLEKTSGTKGEIE